ncbi:hypothetical protein [Bernardetia sp.]|uniref:hypothetical protein n=1 Tax=Bernardetia sp. TaxID=1937974 RepID=UPI0025BD5480|nr:hypothetical protein [Bernardetia sp.]
MKKYILLVLTLGILLKSHHIYAFGLGDETYITPYGNEIDNWMGNDLHTGGKHHFSGLKEWYYYKGFIVGKCRCFAPFDNKERQELGNYVVFNETTHETHFFEEKSEWNAFLNGNGLHPKIWTRWHDGGDGSILYIFFPLIMLFPITIPVLILSLVFLFRNRKKMRQKLKALKYYQIVAIISPVLLIFFIWILEQYPSSI